MRVLVLLACLLICDLVRADDVLVLATDAAKPHFTMLDASGEVVGLERDLTDALCAELDRRCEVIVVA